MTSATGGRHRAKRELNEGKVMGDYQVERDWVTASGLRAVVIMGTAGHRCGYVGVPKGHVLHGAAYSEPHPSLTFPADEEVGNRGIIPLICSSGEARPDVVFNVHGGLTYSGGRDNYPAESDGLWWFGYDCGHVGDGKSDEYKAAMREKFAGTDFNFMWNDCPGDVHRTLAYCVSECESLARQLIERPTTTQESK